MKPSIKPASESPVSCSAADIDAVYAKIARRIIPFLVLLFLMAWLDRYNLGFAKLQMVTDLGFSEAVYGFGAGIVYLGYMLFEIPSNLLLQRIGARKTFARIAILWGITSMAMMFVKTATSFYLLRFLLGSFEAGGIPPFERRPGPGANNVSARCRRSLRQNREADHPFHSATVRDGMAGPL